MGDKRPSKIVLVYRDIIFLGGIQMKRKTIALFLIIALLVPAGYALAAQAESIPQDALTASGYAPIDPHLVLINSVAPSIRVSGTAASYALSITCVSSVNSIRATLQIQRLANGVWTNYGQSWSATSTTSFLSTSGSRTVTSGGTYRLRVTVTASNGTTTGTTTAYSR